MKNKEVAAPEAEPQPAHPALPHKPGSGSNPRLPLRLQENTKARPTALLVVFQLLHILLQYFQL